MSRALKVSQRVRLNSLDYGKRENDYMILVKRRIKEIGASNYRDSCKVKIREREVSILPFFINLMSFIDDEKTHSITSYMYAKDIEELTDMATKEECWYIETLGEENYNILMSLCGHIGMSIPRYLAIGAMKNFEDFYKYMVNILTTEAIEVANGDKSANKYSEGIQNTLALSYYIAIKWFKEMRFVSDKLTGLGDIDEIIEGLLKIPGPIQDYMDKKIDEKELKEAQHNLEFDGDTCTNLSPIYKELLESCGIKASVVNKENLRDYIELGNAVFTYRSGQAFRVFRAGISEVVIKSGVLDKAVKERDYFKNEYNQYLDTVKSCKREVKNSNKTVRRLEEDNNRLKISVAKLKQDKLNLPEQTKKYIAEMDKKINSKNNEIEQLKEQLMILKEDIDSKGKEISKLRTDVKKLSSSEAKALKENEDLRTELECERGSGEIEINCSTPFEVMINLLKDKRILVIGGVSSLGQSLIDIGLNVKQYDCKTNVGLRDFGEYDCMVFITKMLGHSMVHRAKREAKLLGKPIVNFNGSNMEVLCRNIYTILKDK